MKISDTQARQILSSLYFVAEKDKNDMIANAASALAVKFEGAKRIHILSEIEQNLIRYAVKNSPSSYNDTTPRRKTYKRRVSLG